jgi:hypothetical protein
MLFSILFGIIGAALGSFALLLLLILLGVRINKFSSRARRLPAIRHPNFVYGTRVPLTWFNTLCSCLYPGLVNRNSLRAQIDAIFQTVPDDVPAIQSLRLISFELSTSPPIIDEISLETSSKNNEVVFRFRYNPDLACLVALGVRVPFVSEIEIGAHLNFIGFDGAFRLSVPPRTGPMQLRILPSTVIDCDFGVQVGSTMKVTQSVDLAPLWTSLLDWVHGYIHTKVITIPLEEAVLRAPDSRPPKTPERVPKTHKQASKTPDRSPRRLPASPRRKEPNKTEEEHGIRVSHFFDLYPYDF